MISYSRLTLKVCRYSLLLDTLFCKVLCFSQRKIIFMASSDLSASKRFLSGINAKGSSALFTPQPVVFCGPSGSGKSTLLRILMEEFESCFDFSISHTTRKPRPGEINGKDYHFVSRQEMEEAIRNNEFIEFAEFSGNIYGTSRSTVAKIQRTGKICALDVEINGVKAIRKTSLNPKFIFIKPPSIEILEQRLRSRNTETEESLQKRLSRAREELDYGGVPGNFDMVIVNDDMHQAYRELREFLLPEIEAVQKYQE